MAKFGNSGKGGARPLPGVTAENYILPADKFENAQGTAMEYARAAGCCFMITEHTPLERRTWQRYYQIKGMMQQDQFMNRWLSGKIMPDRKHWAVPAQWPWEFDQSVSEEMCRPRPQLVDRP